MLKTKTITLTDNGNQLTFKVKQMPAIPRQDWLNELIVQCAAAGVDIDVNDISSLGSVMNIVKKYGLGAIGNIQYAKLRPLLMQLLGCCYRVIGAAEEQVTEQTAAAYIEDIKTIYKLYAEVISVNFFSGESLSAYLEKANTASSSEK